MSLYVVINVINIPNMSFLIFHFKVPSIDLKIIKKRLKRAYEIDFSCRIAINYESSK